MTDLADLEQAARYEQGEDGEEKVIFPADLWKAYLQAQHEIEKSSPRADKSFLNNLKSDNPQVQGLLDDMKSWNDEEDDTPNTDEWWSDFRKFLAENPVTFGNPEETAALFHDDDDETL